MVKGYIYFRILEGKVENMQATGKKLKGGWIVH